MPLPARPLHLAALFAIIVSAWLSFSLISLLRQADLAVHSQPSSPSSPLSSLSSISGLLRKPAPDACASWNPHDPQESDPPRCLRARQFRQIQALHAQQFPLDETQKLALAQLERCVLGAKKCPERPLIISDYWYAFKRKQSSSGESIWLDPVLDVAEDEGFVLLTFSFYLQEGQDAPLSWNATRLLSESLHMYMPTKDYGFQCLSDPRCVRPADYRPHPLRSLRHDSTLLTPSDIGTTPAWRVFIATYWGDRPENYNGQGESALGQWGQSVDRESPYSSHILDARWHLVPWSYPGHTHIPLSIEQTCLSRPVTPHSERNASVLILAKNTEYFYHEMAPKDWPAIVKAMRDVGVEIWTAAYEGEAELPEGMRRLDRMDKLEYGRVLGSVKALLGIGRPIISPSPFNAVCLGTPALIPYYTDDGPRPGGWKTFKDSWTQHGPALELGEPYVYGYRGTQDLIAQLKRAVRTPIEGYVPLDMSLEVVAERTRAWLYADWEGRYREIVRERRVIEYPPEMSVKCHESRVCKLPILGKPLPPTPL